MSEDERTCIPSINKHLHGTVEAGEGWYCRDSEDFEQEEKEEGESEGNSVIEARRKKVLHEGHIGAQPRKEENDCNNVEELALDDLGLS